MSHWRRIVVGTDFSPPARGALRSARTLAAAARGTIHVVHAVEPLPPRYKLLVGSFEGADLDTERLDAAERRLERLLGRARAAGVALEGAVRLGPAWREILGAARDVEADLICLGNSGHSAFQRLLLGSTAEKVVRNARIPVLVTRRRELRRVDRVLVPVDFDEGSRQALRFVRERFPPRVRMEALHVLPPTPPVPEYAPVAIDEARIERALRDFLHAAGVPRARHAVYLYELPAARIVQHARRHDADLIVISTHGRRGLPRLLLGSVAEKVIRHAHSPVLVLPGPHRPRADQRRAAAA